MVGWTMSVSVHQSNITNIFCQDLKEIYGNIDSKSKIFLTTILSLLGILGVLCNSLVVFCIHKTKQVDIQSIKLYRNFSIIDTFNSIINFVHLKAIIFDPYQTDCMEFYLLRFFLHWAIFSSSYMVPVTGLDRYIHIKYLNNYAIVFTPLKFITVFVLYFICALTQAVASVVLIVFKGAYADLKYTMPLNFSCFLLIVFLQLKSIYLLKNLSMIGISSSKRNIVKIASMYFYFYLLTSLVLIVHSFVTKLLKNSRSVDLSLLSVNRVIFFTIPSFMAIGNALTFLWINRKCRTFLKSAFT